MTIFNPIFTMRYFYVFCLLIFTVPLLSYSVKSSLSTETGKISYSSNWTLKNVSIKTSDGSKVKIENSTNVIFPETIWESKK